MTIDELANNFTKERVESCKKNGLEPQEPWFYKSIYKRGAKDAIKEIDIFIQNHIHSFDLSLAKIKEMLEEE